MAENILQTTIVLRYGTYHQWMTSNIILRKGEPAIVIFPYDYSIINGVSPDFGMEPENTPPAIGIKIGDGISQFSMLPWIQAIAADVHSWAKAKQKPTYTATDIKNLNQYIQERVPDSYTYRLISHTNNSGQIDEYRLQYKKIDANEWNTDTSCVINLNDLVAIKNWLGQGLSVDNLDTRTEDHINYKLEELSHQESEIVGSFVTSVSQTNGLISTTRSTISFSNIDGAITVAQGGTGLRTVPENTLLVGTGNNILTTRNITNTLEDDFNISTNHAIRTYIDEKTNNLTNILKYIGIATVSPINEVTHLSVDPQIENYVFARARIGDIVLWESKEYIWTEYGWKILGDEYTIETLLSDVTDIYDRLNNKVDIIDGKQLSTHDFTTEYRIKLDGIEAGAQVNDIEHIYIGQDELTITNKTVTITPLTLFINGVQQKPNEANQIRLNSDDISSVTGAKVYNRDVQDYVTIDIDPEDKKLILNGIAQTGNIREITQFENEYVLINCGSSTQVMDDLS